MAQLSASAAPGRLTPKGRDGIKTAIIPGLLFREKAARGRKNVIMFSSETDTFPWLDGRQRRRRAPAPPPSRRGCRIGRA